MRSSVRAWIRGSREAAPEIKVSAELKEIHQAFLDVRKSEYEDKSIDNLISQLAELDPVALYQALSHQTPGNGGLKSGLEVLLKITEKFPSSHFNTVNNLLTKLPDIQNSSIKLKEPRLGMIEQMMKNKQIGLKEAISYIHNICRICNDERTKQAVLKEFKDQISKFWSSYPTKLKYDKKDFVGSFKDHDQLYIANCLAEIIPKYFTDGKSATADFKSEFGLGKLAQRGPTRSEVDEVDVSIPTRGRSGFSVDIPAMGDAKGDSKSDRLEEIKEEEIKKIEIPPAVSKAMSELLGSVIEGKMIDENFSKFVKAVNKNELDEFQLVTLLANSHAVTLDKRDINKYEGKKTTMIQDWADRAKSDIEGAPQDTRVLSGITILLRCADFNPGKLDSIVNNIIVKLYESEDGVQLLAGILQADEFKRAKCRNLVKDELSTDSMVRTILHMNPECFKTFIKFVDDALIPSGPRKSDPVPFSDRILLNISKQDHYLTPNQRENLLYAVKNCTNPSLKSNPKISEQLPSEAKEISASPPKPS